MNSSERQVDIGDNPITLAARERMVAEQIMRRGISDPRVLEAMRRVPRHQFIPPESSSVAYDDAPQPIGHGQTISQPYMVASMTELLELRPDSRVLEIGTGSGYQTAVLASLAGAVYTIELNQDLAQEARSRLGDQGFKNIEYRIGDGSLGWPEASPFEGIMVTAAAANIPQRLSEQLADGGRMVIPVHRNSPRDQVLLLGRKNCGQVSFESLYSVRFVPLLAVEKGAS
jgi:protein-L-isoaspartate(D-aspartate) O-methyltransferase